MGNQIAAPPGINSDQAVDASTERDRLIEASNTSCGEPEELHRARIDLTAALRTAARLGLNEGVCNHFSLEVPGNSKQFLINPQGLHWSEIRPSDLVIVDEQGNLIKGNHSVEPTAFFIHGRIHLGKQKACILHTHMPYATSLCLLEDGELLVGANQNSMRFYNRIGYDRNYGGVALDKAEGDRICAALGDKDIVFLQHHGVIVCGTNVVNAFDDLYYLERSCMVQVLAQGTGKMIKTVPDIIVRDVASQIESQRQQSILHFSAMKRLLTKDDPSWDSFNS